MLHKWPPGLFLDLVFNDFVYFKASGTDLQVTIT